MRVTGNAASTLRSVHDGGAGLVVTDPPWDMSGGGRFEQAASYARMSAAEVAEVLDDARRALVPGGHLYMFAPTGEMLPEVFAAFGARGWRFIRELAWDKGIHRGLGAYRNAWEPVLIWSNGPSRGFNHQGRFPSLLRVRHDSQRTSKPWQLYKVFLEMSSRPGELVVDPFCGTNPLQEAAAHVAPARRWLAGDVLSPEAIEADLARRNWRTTQGRRAVPA